MADEKEVTDISKEDADWIENNLDDSIDTEGEFKSTLFLSTDGKMTVSVEASTTEGRKASLIYAKRVYERLISSYGSKQGTAVREYKKAESEIGGAKFTCQFCGAPATAKSGIAKSGKKWSAIFCSTDDKNHTVWQ